MLSLSRHLQHHARSHGGERTTVSPAPAATGAAAPSPASSSFEARACATDPPAMDPETVAWIEKFLAAVSGVTSATDPASSSQLLRKLVRTGLLR